MSLTNFIEKNTFLNPGYNCCDIMYKDLWQRSSNSGLLTKYLANTRTDRIRNQLITLVERCDSEFPSFCNRWNRLTVAHSAQYFALFIPTITWKESQSSMQCWIQTVVKQRDLWTFCTESKDIDYKELLQKG